MKLLPAALVAAVLAMGLAGCSGPTANPTVHLTVTAKSAVSDGSVDETVGAPCGDAAIALLAVDGVEMDGGVSVEEANGDLLGSAFWDCTVTEVDENAPDEEGNPGVQISVAYTCDVDIAGTPLGKTVTFVSGTWASTAYPVEDIKPQWELTVAAN